MKIKKNPSQCEKCLRFGLVCTWTAYVAPEPPSELFDLLTTNANSKLQESVPEEDTFETREHRYVGAKSAGDKKE